MYSTRELSSRYEITRSVAATAPAIPPIAGACCGSAKKGQAGTLCGLSAPFAAIAWRIADALVNMLYGPGRNVTR